MLFCHSSSLVNEAHGGVIILLTQPGYSIDFRYWGYHMGFSWEPNCHGGRRPIRCSFQPYVLNLIATFFFLLLLWYAKKERKLARWKLCKSGSIRSDMPQSAPTNFVCLHTRIRKKKGQGRKDRERERKVFFLLLLYSRTTKIGRSVTYIP